MRQRDVYCDEHASTAALEARILELFSDPNPDLTEKEDLEDMARKLG